MKTSCTEEQIAEIFDLYGDMILRAAYTYVKNLHDAEDILQETIVKYLEHTGRFESEEHRKAWLLRVAINLSKNKCKSAWRKFFVMDEQPENYITQAVEEKETYDEVLEAVLALPVKYKEVIHLFYYEEYSVTEIAALLGKNPNTIKSLLIRGREKLRHVLKEEWAYE